MGFTEETVRFRLDDTDKQEINKTLISVYRSLEEKGYRGGRVKIDHADNFDSAAELHDLIRKKRPEARVDLGTCRALCSFYAEAGGLMIGVEI